MNRICIIVPYFGKLPDNFPVTLITCKKNNNVDWILFTDDKTSYSYPSNWKVKYLTFEELKYRIQSKFNFNISLTNPKKLCDYKPAYGYIFQEEIKNYDFWGYCDLDQYFGNLNKFITNDIMTRYDKLFSLGHLTLYRNTPLLNTLYKRTYSANVDIKSYKEIYTKNQNFIFDEWPKDIVNINKLAKQENINTYSEWIMADILPYRSYFVGSKFDALSESWSIENYKNSVIYWCNGSIYNCYIDKGELIKREVIYVHIQKRKLKTKNFNNDSNEFLIVPNKIIFKKNGFNDTDIVYFIKKQAIRCIFHQDELKHKTNSFIHLWKYRFEKYFLKK